MVIFARNRSELISFGNKSVVDSGSRVSSGVGLMIFPSCGGRDAGSSLCVDAFEHIFENLRIFHDILKLT